MTPSARLRLAVVALLIAVASVVSAAWMSPAPPAAPALQAYLDAGGTVDDLCGDVSAPHDHRCPFCRLLGDPPRVAFAPRADRAVLAAAPPARRALTAGPQGGNPRISPRAPPALA